MSEEKAAFRCIFCGRNVERRDVREMEYRWFDEQGRTACASDGPSGAQFHKGMREVA
jgi:hypothetical protein